MGSTMIREKSLVVIVVEGIAPEDIKAPQCAKSASSAAPPST